MRHISPKGSASKSEILVYFLAAPEDEATCEAIYRHLSTIRFSSPMPVEMMGDFRMTGGEEIASYRQKIADADIVLAFISVDFLNNNDCYEYLKTVIDNHNRGKAILLPILVRNCMWKATPFANLPLLPKNHQPLNNKQFWNSEDDALTNVADDIYESISHLTQHSTPEAPLPVANTTTLKTNWRGSYLWTNFWKRTVAYMLDVLILILPVIVVLYLVFGDNFISDAGEIPVQYGVVYTALLILVFSYFDSSKWRGSPGKHIMKLQISDDAGNPISFSKAAVRNTIKFLLFGFVGTLQNSGDVSLLIMAAQIICFVTTRKFIH
ncbi:MAG TPA: RDD family protein, partial [Flavisolibacter sp.]|nr:RDD family protein [Flavisolibacter sp.]